MWHPERKSSMNVKRGQSPQLYSVEDRNSNISYTLTQFLGAESRLVEIHSKDSPDGLPPFEDLLKHNLMVKVSLAPLV
jgi:hypothetical protein